MTARKTAKAPAKAKKAAAPKTVTIYRSLLSNRVVTEAWAKRYPNKAIAVQVAPDSVAAAQSALAAARAVVLRAGRGVKKTAVKKPIKKLTARATATAIADATADALRATAKKPGAKVAAKKAAKRTTRAKR